LQRLGFKAPATTSSGFAWSQVTLTVGRSRILSLTAEGAALLKEAFPLWKKVRQSIGRAGGSATILELREQLTRLE